MLNSTYLCVQVRCVRLIQTYTIMDHREEAYQGILHSLTHAWEAQLPLGWQCWRFWIGGGLSLGRVPLFKPLPDIVFSTSYSDTKGQFLSASRGHRFIFLVFRRVRLNLVWFQFKQYGLFHFIGKSSLPAPPARGAFLSNNLISTVIYGWQNYDQVVQCSRGGPRTTNDCSGDISLVSLLGTAP